MKRILVVGYGSIGRRHSQNFGNLGCQVGIVSRRQLSEENVYADIQSAIVSFSPDVVFLCNETHLHGPSLLEIARVGYRGLAVVEKPLFGLDFDEMSVPPGLDVRVSYNLRFHPLLKKLKTELDGQKVVSADVYVGQYLPTWRPQTDYRTCYSADEIKGGGVLLDLSHELDYCQWLFGDPRGLFSRSGKWSALEINSMDTCGIILEYENCRMLTMQLNYLDRITQRQIVVNTDSNSYRLDFIAKKLICNGSEIFSEAASDSYLEMSKDILGNQGRTLTSYAEAVSIMRTMRAAISSNSSKEWKSL